MGRRRCVLVSREPKDDQVKILCVGCPFGRSTSSVYIREKKGCFGVVYDVVVE